MSDASPAGHAPVPQLSVVVPCFQCADVIGASVDKLTSFLEGAGRSWEVVLVDDGSRDGTWQVLTSRADGEQVHAIRLPENRGKGRAVAEGMRVARGACRLFTDADLPYALEAVPRCVDIVEAGRFAVFGNRLLPDSDARAQPWLRRHLGTGVRLVVGFLLGRRDVDTQCGLKAFSGPAAEILFRDLRTGGFLFDVEVTLLLTRAGVPVDFVPVDLVNHDKSTVRFFSTGLRALGEAWSIIRLRAADREKVAALSALYRRSNT